MKKLSVLIFNLSEDVWPFIQSLEPQKQAYEIAENTNLAERGIWSLPPKAVLITALSFSPQFLAYSKSILKPDYLEILVPQKNTGRVSLDTLADPKLLARLRKLGQDYQLELTCYTASTWFYQLVDYLRHQGLTITTPESPDQDHLWTRLYLGSKGGIRQVVDGGFANIKMADGQVCFDLAQAVGLAAQKYLAKNGVVIKTNHGHAGMGILIIRPGEISGGYQAVASEIQKRLQEPYWQLFPIVVEDYVKTSKVGGGFPNVECFVTKNKITMLYACGMRVDQEGVFHGVIISDKAFSPRYLKRLYAFGTWLGKIYQKYGYRGYYDIDFAAGLGGHLYVTESNTRHTGGTHVYLLGKKLIGPRFMRQTYTLSNIYRLSQKQTLTSLLNQFKPILFNPQTKEGLVIISENLLSQNNLDYVIFAKTQAHALALEARMEQLLKSL